MDRSHPSKSSLLEDRRLIGEARRCFERGRPEQAEVILQQVLKSNPDSVQAHVALGIIAAETGRNQIALQRMEQALSADPNCLPALCWLSHLRLQGNQIEIAQRAAERALHVEPDNPVAHAALARCLARQKLFADAVPHFRKSLEIGPELAKTRYELADALIALGLEGEAVDSLKKALELAPNVPSYLKLAYLHLNMGELSQAEASCGLAFSINPHLGAAHILMGKICTEGRRPSEALNHWRKAEEAGVPAETIYREMAQSLNSIGQFDEAITSLRRSIELKPSQGAAYQSLIFAKRIVPDDLPLVKQMEGLVSKDTLPDHERLSLLYSLGKSYDNLGDFETAIGWFDQANALKLRMLGGRPLDRERLKALIDERIDTFTPAIIAQASNLAMSTSLPILVVGMMRSGTTLAEQMLSCHPRVGGAGEQTYWGDHEGTIVDFERSRINDSELRRCASEYVQLLSQICPGSPHVIDKNPTNLLSVGSIHLAIPNARIIHTRRNAIDTALSIWMTPLRTDAPFVCDRSSIVYAYKQYLRLAQHWREVVPENRLLEISYEELVCNPEVKARELVYFCGLEWNEACLHPESNTRAIKTPSMWQARQPIYQTSTERWKRYEPWLGEFSELAGLG